MDIEAILRTLAMVGADSPAYRALFDQVVAIVGETDQHKLKIALAEAADRSDAQHRRAQAGG